MPRVNQNKFMNLNLILAKAEEFEGNLPDFPPSDGIGKQPIASFIDHTLLKPEATIAQIEKLCSEARTYQFASVCLNPIFVERAHLMLLGSGVKTCTVIGFPLGATPTAVKVFEARMAIEQGAEEIDMVIPVGILKSGEFSAVLDDIHAVVEISHRLNSLVKVIHEMVLLTQREKIIASLLTQAAQADFVKTSTGFGPGGATLEDVELMRRVVGPMNQMGVKAAGGIRSLSDANAMIKAGANRLGTSAGVKIVQEALADRIQS
jgi:deoxyribose-phosphate aldolase